MKSSLLATTALLGTLCLLAGSAEAADATNPSHIANPVERVEGQSPDTVLSPELSQTVVAAGAMKLDGATGIFHSYGYVGDGPLTPADGGTPAGQKIEAQKTEPDKNTYLVLDGQKGADAAYNYGTHFLFQGHEGGIEDGGPTGYITRINLDADEAHRVTLMASADADGKPLQLFDGSTYDPFTKQLLLASEEGETGGVWMASLDYPSKVTTNHGAFGHGAYEGIQVDKDGNIWLVEDEGGKTSETLTKVRQPNSFVYRFKPKDKADLSKGGVLQALQYSAPDGTPVTFHKGEIDADAKNDGIKALHTYGTVLKAKFVTVHDTDKDGTAEFDANALAKAAGASPLKRPENGVFRPGTDFTEFYFTETGDNNLKTDIGADYGVYGGIVKVKLANASADDAEVSSVYVADGTHSGLDNLNFWTANVIAAVQDNGDTVHAQRKGLDTGLLIDVTADYSKGTEPVRFIAEGRDPSATIDSKLAEAEIEGFTNDGDNELTGIHISDGDASEAGILGAKIPTPFSNGWRVFYTQQHGLNQTWEITPKS